MGWNELMGTRVIAVSNEPGPCMVGTLKRTETIHTRPIPVVTMEHNGQEYIVMGILLPFRQDVLNLLNSMPHPEAWQFCVGFSHLIQAKLWLSPGTKLRES